MTARAALREGTAEAHERVDALFSRFALDRPGDYRRFLLAQAAAFVPIEAALDEGGAGKLIADWPQRRRSHLLLRDLEELGAAEWEPIPAPPLPGPAEMLGAIYVLEGSRLGGAMLKRSLAEEAPRSFLSAPQAPGSWRKLLDNLDRLLYSAEPLNAAIVAARQVFQKFEAAGLRYAGTQAE